MFGRIVKAGIRNKKTTLLGLIGGLLVILKAAHAVLDDDPATVLDAQAVYEAGAGIVMILWGLISRDADKTSKDSGVE